MDGPLDPRLNPEKNILKVPFFYYEMKFFYYTFFTNYFLFFQVRIMETRIFDIFDVSKAVERKTEFY